MRTCLLSTLLILTAVSHAAPLELDLQTRDPKTGKTVTRKQRVEAVKIGVVLVDPWNFHWCMTAAARVGAMVPRWNAALRSARKLGMTVVFAPTDVASQYVGTPQRERSLGVPYLTVPNTRSLSCRFTCGVGGCMCGPGICCVVNYGWDGMHPGLVIGEGDYIVSGLQEMYSVCKQRGLTHLLYTGLHTNMCLFGKPPAVRNLHGAGFECIVARDINDAFTHYDPARGFTPCDGTAWIDRDLEKAGIPTVNMLDEMRKAGAWRDAEVVDTVRISPWGTRGRPYFFEKSVAVSLSAPWIKDAEIRYTLDGAEPTAGSPQWAKPLSLSKTAHLRTAAFRKGRRVSLISDARFVRLATPPPAPDVDLHEIQPMKRQYPHKFFFHFPKTNQSYGGKPLRIRRRTYKTGIGMRAPANVRFELKAEHERFVALAGVDDRLIDTSHGAMKAMHASVVFKVYIDGTLAAESPVMRISQEPWRFDVKIPKGSRRINLVATDAGSRHPYDLANWADAGFLLTGSENRLPTLHVPGYWDRSGRYPTHDGFAWYRCFVVVPKTWAGRDLTLMVPAVDNCHESYFNGRKVGAAGAMPPNYVNGLDSEKPCTVPAKLVRPGEGNFLAVRVYDAGGAGGFRDGPPTLSLGKQIIKLEGRWLFHLGDKPEWATWPKDKQSPAYVTFRQLGQ